MAKKKENRKKEEQSRQLPKPLVFSKLKPKFIER